MAVRLGMKPVFLLGLLSACLLLHTCCSSFVSDEASLRSALLTGYSTKTRPEAQTNVTVTLVLSSLLKLDISEQVMSLAVTLRSQWADSRLTWTPASYGGIEYLVTDPEDIWTPPLVLENAVDDFGVVGGKLRDAVPLRILYDGAVSWSPPLAASTACDMTISHYPFDSQRCSVVVLGWTYPVSEVYIAAADSCPVMLRAPWSPPRAATTSCDVTISHYPFDTQRCSVVVLGWTYPVSEVDITILASPVDTETLYSRNGEFDLVQTGTHSENLGVLTGPVDTYRKIYFDLTYRRKWEFYGQNLLYPIVLNSILMAAVFLLPIESGEKMGYSLTVLLSYIVFLTWVTDNLPPVSTDTSILQVYLAVVLCMGVTATLLTTWVLHLYHSPPHKPVSRFFRRVAVRVLLPVSVLGGCALPLTPRKDARLSEGDDLGFSRKLAKVRPTGPLDAESSSEVNCVPGFDTSEKDGGGGGGGKGGGGADSSLEETATFTWQELAVLFDKFFLWIFSFSLLFVTTVILALLYGNY